MSKQHAEQPEFEALVLREARATWLQEVLLHAPLVVGVSGGADSLALLHALCKLRGQHAGRTLHVAHLDHGFRGEDAAKDAEFVIEVAAKWGLPYTVRRFDVPAYARANGLSPEDAARRARYAFLAGVACATGGTVTVAHNADDQAETVLMHLLRGSGTGGLAGMQSMGYVPVPQGDTDLAELLGGAPQSSIPVFRPLLNIPRAAIEAYCKQQRLEPRTDLSNFDLLYRRNLVRHSVIPALEKDFPSLKKQLNNLAKVAGAEDEMLAAMTEEEWRLRVIDGHGAGQIRLDTAGFGSLPLALRRRFARRALKAVAGTLDDFSFSRIEEMVAVLTGGTGSPPAIDLPHGIRVSREGNAVMVACEQNAANIQARIESTPWPAMLCDEAPVAPLPACVKLGADWRLKAEVITPQEATRRPGDYLAHFDWDMLQSLGTPVVRTRQPGDTIQPLGMGGRKSLQDLFVDAKIPRWARGSLALIALSPSREILWTPGPGGRRSVHAPIGEDTKQVLALEFARGDAS